MAQPSNYCSTQCYSYGCGNNHRAARPNYTYSWPDITDRPTAAFTNALRTACNQELEARGLSKRVSSSNVVKDTTEIAKTGSVEILTDLKNCINTMSSGYVTNSYTRGTALASKYWTDLRDKLQKLMRDCLCHSDCGANAWCTCYNDCGCNYCDINLKHDIKSIKDSNFIEKFMQIEPKEWKYNTTNETHIGLIAQDVEKKFPSAVSYDENGYMKLNNIDLIGIMWHVIQNQQKEIDQLKQAITNTK